MDLLKLYSSLILEPLENEIKNLKRKEKMNFFITKNIKTNILNQLETLLQDYYKRYYKLREKELKLQDNFKLKKETDRN